MTRYQSFGRVASASTGGQFNDSASHDAVGATSAARIRRAVRFALEPLEDRVLLSAADPLLPNEVTAIRNGLKNLSDWADTLDAFGDLGKQLPFVGRSIGQALDAGTTLRNALYEPIKLLPNPSPAQIESAIEGALSGSTVAVNVVLTDPTKILFEITLNRQTTENRPLDFGTNAAGVNVDSSFTAELKGTLQANFTFGFDKTIGLADDEAFFVVAPVGSFTAKASVGIANAAFGLSLGLLGPDADGSIDAGVRATGGSLNLTGELKAGLNDQNSDGRVSLDEIQSTSLGSLVSTQLVHNGNDLAGSLTVQANLGTFSGTGTVSVTDANLFDATAPDVQLSSTTLDQFKNLTAEGFIGLIRNAGTSLQTLAKGLNPSGGIPFVGEAISQAVNFAELFDNLTAPLFDARLTGATSHVSQSASAATLTSAATFTVSRNGGAPVSVTSITGALATVAADLDTKLAAAGVDAAVESGRLKLSSADGSSTLTVQWHADDAGMDQLGFVDTVSNAVFRFNSLQSAAPILAQKMGIPTAGKTPAEILALLGISYDLPADALLFNIKYEKAFQKPIELNFTDTIPVGLGQLAVTGALDASVSANAKVDVQVGLNLANLADFDGGTDPFSNAGADDLFVKSGGKVSGNATFTGTGNLMAALGILELGIHGASANFTAGGEFTLGNPGDGKINPGEFLAPGVITLPVFNASGNVDLPLQLSGAEDLGIVLPGGAKVRLTFSAAPTTGVTFAASATGLEDLFKQLTNFSTDNVFSVLQNVVGLIQNSELELFNQPLPLVNKSIKEMLDFATKLSDGLAGITGGLSNLKEKLLGNATGAGSAPAGLIQAVKDALANSPMLDQLNTLGDQGKHAAHELLHTVDGLQDALHSLPEQNDVTFKVPANLIAALANVNHALHHAEEQANALPAGAVKTDILEGLEAVEDALGPISKALPAVQRLVDFLFEALDLRSLITAAGFDAIKTQVLNKLDSALTKVTEAIALIPDDAANAAKKQAFEAAKAALTGARGEVNDAVAAITSGNLDDLNLPALLKAFNKVNNVIKEFGGAGQAFDDTAAADEAGDFLRQARNIFSASFPGRPTLNFANGEFEIGFDFDISKPVDVPLDFDLNETALGVLPLEVSTGGMLHIELGAAFSLNFGVNLNQLATGPLDPGNILDSTYLRDTTGFKLTGLIDGNNISAKVAIGAIEAIDLGPGTVFLKEVATAANTNPAKLSLELKDNTDGTADGKIALSDFSLANFKPDGTGQFKLSMPVSIAGGAPLAQPIVIELGNIKDFDSLSFTLPPDLVSELQKNLLSVDFLINGLIQFLDRLSNGLISDILNKLPVVGDAIDFAGSALGDLLAQPADGAAFAPPNPDGFIDGLKSALEGFADTGRQAVEDKLRHVFFDLLGPGGIDLLILDPKKHDSDGDAATTDTVADWHDVDISVSADLNAPADAKIVAKLPLGKKDDASTEEFEGDIVHAPFDLGFNGLGLVGFQTTGAVELKLQYSIDLAFEISKAGGFSILLDTGPVAAGDPVDKKEIEIKVEAGFTDGTRVNAKLFFLSLEATNADTNGDSILTSILGDASVDLTGGSGGKVPITDIGTLKFNPEINAAAQIDLGLTTGISTGAIEPNTNLPTLRANLLVMWNFHLTPGSGVSTESPSVELNNIRLDLGGFINKVLGPVIDTIDDFLSPIQPLLDLLDTEIPVISQVAQLVGADPVRFIDAIQFLGQGSETVQRVLDILLAVKDIVDTASSFIDDGSLIIPFGDLKFGKGDALDKQLAANFGNLRDKFTDKFDGTFGGVSQAAKDFINGLRGGGGGSGFAASAFSTDLGEFAIPLFDDPFQIINLFFGKDVDLVTWDVPRMEASFEFSQLFGPIIPPFPVFAKIGGGFGIFADLFLGVDTRGLRTGNFEDSIYFGDRDPTTPAGKDTPELGVFLEFKAGAELSIPFAKAGVEGGIRADINADWNDPDENGKVHLDELAANFARGLECVFDLTGKFDAFISAYLNIEIPLGFTSITIVDVSFDIFRATLFDFTITCPPLPPPVPTTLEGGVLKLNIGDRAKFRQPGATDTDEKIELFGEGDRNGDGIISLTEDVNGDGKISADEVGEEFDGVAGISSSSIFVIGFGVHQIFKGVSSIVGNAGEGDDKVLIDATVKVGATITAGNGDDVIKGGSGNDNLAGDEGTDEISGGKGNDSVTGGNANDKLSGGAGSDTVRGGEGDDTVYGGSNDGVEGSKTPADTSDDDLGDSVFGDGGNDQVYGHLGNDTMRGGSGADNLTGGAGNDDMGGDGDNDLMFGDAGNDTMTGGTGDDQMKGGDDADNLSGNDGNDYMEGSRGGDTVAGDNGDDKLIGGSADDKAGDDDGADSVSGGAGADTILGDNGIIGSVTLFGGLGNDTLSGGTGADLIYGQGGNDTIDAGSENDTVFAGAGLDVVHGDAGNDLVLGEGDDDKIFGDAGNDTVEAGLGNDSVYGNTGDDLLKGQEGHDSIEGNAGSDVILGGIGNDSIIGGSSDDAQITAGGEAGDSIVGSAGNDIILGDNGTISVTGNVVTIATGGAGSDTVFGGADSDTIFGGGFGDVLNGDSAVDSGNDLVVGDQGTKTTTGGITVITADHSAVADSGGNDSIFGSSGNDTMLGGDGNDTVSGDSGADVALGDNGKVTVNGTTVIRTETTDEAFGGDDQITGGTESDILLGGTGNDLLSGGDGAFQDIVLGDNGVVVGPNGAEDGNDVFTTDPTLGGLDTITGGAGDDIFLGGSGGADLAPANAAVPNPAIPSGDSIDGGEGNDIALGDNGRVVRDGSAVPVVQLIVTTDELLGGHDSIVGGAGGDTALGGFGRDSIVGGTEADVLLGDNGLIRLVAGPTLADVRIITTTFPNAGDSDTILGGDGNDTVMGGTNSESILGGNGNDLVFGDHGKVLLDDPSNRNFFSIDTAASHGGAPDTILGEAGDDTVLGGQGGDQIFGGTEDDDLIGGHNVAGGSDTGDTIDGGAGNDAIAGDNASIIRQVGPSYTSPLVRTLAAGATAMYTIDPVTGLSTANVNGTPRAIPGGTVGRDVVLFDHTATTPANTFSGDDNIAGGAGNDSVWGQLGNDLLRGDASVTDGAGPLTASADAATDGDDYVEGNGGNDLIFGNQGRDDLIGGNSSLFGLTTRDQRPDGADAIYGGSGTAVGRNHDGNTTEGGHARDSDFIVGDNANVFRLVSVAPGGVSSYLLFSYDNYPGTLRLVPRALQLLDYTADDNATNDVGGADVIHGEAGDDSIHGMGFDDVLFGEGQDDDVIGASGNDWISGGTGIDGILGDDGRIMTSRNGTAEVLHGIAATTQTLLSLPGGFTSTVLNPTGRLTKAADLEPFDIPNAVNGNDTVYGGMGDDYVHGGLGNDAISGAEALAVFYDAPTATPKLNFGVFNDGPPATIALAKIAGHLLNFDASEADGKDVLFGDTGNDWLVGGRNSDHLYGGFGDDILNNDDNLETNGGANDVPDEGVFRESDTAFGGGGRDTLLGNTGEDRLFDWVGEFDSFVVPFAPFGQATITREHSPLLVTYLLLMSRSDGADPTRLGQRNGEPFGELGLVTPQDAIWQEQTGGPADPQAGNKPGGKKDR